MKKRMFCLVLCLAMTLGTAAHAAEAEAVTAAVVVDGVTMENFVAVSYNSISYASLYGMTLALRPDAAITWEDGQMVARGSDFTLSARVGAPYMVVNGRYLYIPDKVKADAMGDTLVPARTLATALGAAVAWEPEVGVSFTGGGAPLLSGDAFYNADDLDLLARVIMHESGNQSLRGKIAVANVILNRVASPIFPSTTVRGVLFEPYQFPGATNATPTAECVIAAKLALDGAVTAPGALYFNRAGKTSWASRNRPYLTTIGGHAFYG